MRLFNELTSIDIFSLMSNQQQYVGRPFYLNFSKTGILTSDAWKHNVKGIPQGSFLLAFYDNEEDVSEALLLRVLSPTKLPTDNDIVCSMVEYYKDNLYTSGRTNQLDEFTRYEFSFSGLECRILGTFYKDTKGTLKYGADVENFYSPNNYRVYKPTPDILERIVNFKSSHEYGHENDIKFGKIRYSSTTRFQEQEDEVPVYITAQDFLGKRTALFGMTRTGKSNSVKKIIEATVELSNKAPNILNNEHANMFNLDPFTEEGYPKYPVGQIIFDVNGEYANPNNQDKGTAIYEIYKDNVERYSVLEKPGFKVMKVNFYKDVKSGFQLLKSYLSNEDSDFINNFKAINLPDPKKVEELPHGSEKTRCQRILAAYYCCLKQAGFLPSSNMKTIKFPGEENLNKLVQKDGLINPSKGVTFQQAINWFTTIWDNYATHEFFKKYKSVKGHEWADNDLKALLVMLTRKREPGKGVNCNGFLKLRPIKELHTNSIENSFEICIEESLRKGKIVIVDLSQGNPDHQKLYSERLCQSIFQKSMDRFIKNMPNNFIQFYFEEAHNLFPKKEDKDLSQIYNRIAKEGAKLNLGLIYATQEVSSISSSILKNTQNWFIAHLNNHDEIKELKKYYDFEDFSDALVRFSPTNDKGFVRMKTYSNSFVIPVQIDKFLGDRD